jgi:hypothetical protein
MANVATDEEVRALKRAICAQPNAGTLGWQQAGFGGQQVGSRPSFSALGCRCVVAEGMQRFGDLYRSAKLVLVRRSLAE